MAERKLTILGKLVVLIFVAACFAGAFFLYKRTNTPSAQAPAPTASAPAPVQPAPTATPAQPASAPLIQADVLVEAKARRSLIVGYEDDNSAPMYYLQGGQRDGFEYQLALHMAGKLGLPSVQFVQADYASLPNLLKTRQADVVIAGYVPDPSVTGVEWSDSYLDFGLCLIVLKSSAYSNVSQLAGKTIGVYDDPAAIRWVQDNIPGARILTYSGDSGWFEALERREIDALIYDYPFASTEIKAHPKAKMAQFNLNSAHYSVGVLANNDPLLDAINNALGSLMSSSTYRDLVVKYLDYQTADLSKPVAGAKTYTVKPGDTLSIIAQSQLGSPGRWQEIWELNKNRIPNPHLIHASYVLLMP